MATFYFNCPQCGNQLSSEEEWRGMETQCPYCQKRMIIPNSVLIQPQNVCRSGFFKSKIKLIVIGIVAVLLTVSAALYFVTKNTSMFLIEEIAGVNIGQSVTNKNPDGSSVFSDFFHCFKISEKYKGKIIFEKVSFPASASDMYIGDGTAVVSSPAAIADGSSNIRWLSIAVTDRELFVEIINDFAAKGFGSGQKGYSPSARTVHISDLKQCDFSKTEIYSFTSGDRQYQLHVLTGEIPGLLKHEAKIHCARLVLSGKIPKESRKGIRLLMKSDGFLDTLMITGTSKTAMFTHAIIHHKGKSSICNHIDGFDN